VLTTQVVLTVRQGDLAMTSFAANLGTRSQRFTLFPAAKLPNVTFRPLTDAGFVLLLQPSAGERFQISAGSFRLVLALTMAEVGANGARLVSTFASGYIRVELVDLQSSAQLDADWFTSDTTTGLDRDAGGKWVVRMRGSSKLLTRAMSFAGIRISYVYVTAPVARRDSSLVTVVANPSASVSVTYTLG
jgi:hypothetical protein